MSQQQYTFNKGMTKEQFKKQKERELKKLMRKQLSLIKKVAKISIVPAKRPSTTLCRVGKLLAIGLQIRQLEMQKQMIIAQPIPNYIKGGVSSSGIAIVGEAGLELIITPNGSINVPTAYQHPNPHIEPA
jgi:hypothetical protein